MSLTTAEEKAWLIHAIMEAFPLDDAPRPLVRDDAPTNEFHREIVEIFSSGRWNEISISDWRWLGVGIGIARHYMTTRAFIYFLPSLMCGGLEDDDLEFAVEALLPANQRWEPGGERWDAFMNALDGKQRAAIREFLNCIVRNEAEGGAIRAGAEHALWRNLYD